MEDPRLECCKILQEFQKKSDPLFHIYERDKDGYKWFSEEKEVKRNILELLKPLYTKTIDSYYWDPYSGLLEAGLKHGYLLVDQDFQELQKILNAWYDGEYIRELLVSGKRWRVSYDKFISGWYVVEDIGKHQVPGELKNLEFLESIFPGEYEDKINDLLGKTRPKKYYHIYKSGFSSNYSGKSNDWEETKRQKKLERRQKIREWRKKRKVGRN